MSVTAVFATVPNIPLKEELDAEDSDAMVTVAFPEPIEMLSRLAVAINRTPHNTPPCFVFLTVTESSSFCAILMLEIVALILPPSVQVKPSLLNDVSTL